MSIVSHSHILVKKMSDVSHSHILVKKKHACFSFTHFIKKMSIVSHTHILVKKMSDVSRSHIMVKTNECFSFANFSVHERFSFTRWVGASYANNMSPQFHS